MGKILILQNPIANKIEAENMPEILWLAKQIYGHETDKLTKRDSDCRKLSKFMEKIFVGIRYIDNGFLKDIIIKNDDPQVSIGQNTIKKGNNVYAIPPDALPIWKMIIENKIDWTRTYNIPMLNPREFLGGFENLQAVLTNTELEIIIRT